MLEAMKMDCRKAANLIKSSRDILIVSHIDADGITSAAIAATTCERIGIPYEVVFAKKLNEETIEMINTSEKHLVWVTDLGSAYLSNFSRDRLVVTDHHIPDTKWRKGQTFLDDYNILIHINPHLYGMDGSIEVCGAGMTYQVSKAVDSNNKDLAYLAIIGACGDIQDTPESGMISLNRQILNEAVSNGDIEVNRDLRLFGRETRTLVQFLQYSSDPRIPGLTEEYSECIRLFNSLGIPYHGRCWNDLNKEEKGKIISVVLDLIDTEDMNRAFGDAYTLPKNNQHSELRDAKEYATLLNSCGRYEDAETGMRICMGDPEAVKSAKNNRVTHKQNISSAITYIKEKQLVKIRNSVQYFDAGSEIKETVVGIVAGMILTSEGFRKDLPMIAFADAEDGTKVSARADRSLIKRGLNLSEVMSKASELVGGFGGGHSVAAGATIPKGKEKEFLEIVDDIVTAQLI